MEAYLAGVGGKGIGEGLKGLGEGLKAGAEGVSNSRETWNKTTREDDKHYVATHDQKEEIRKNKPLNDQLAEHQRELANNHAIDIVKAVYDGDARAVRRALKQGGADPNDTINWSASDGSEYKNDPLLTYAVVQEDIGLVQALLSASGINVDGLGSTGFTPLLQAVTDGNLPITKLLLQHGADINLEAGDVNNTPLLQAVLYNNSPLVQFLLTKGANPNLASGDPSGPPLIDAALKGSLQLCSLLLRHDAEPDGKDINGVTALLVAAQGGHRDIAELLISGGADPTVVVQGKFTAADQAEACGFPELSKWLSKRTKQ